MLKSLPVWVERGIVTVILLSLIPLAYIAVLREIPSEQPRMSIVPDMDKQQKYLPQSENAMFADGRGMRVYPAGTVAADNQSADAWLTQGIVDGQWATSFPMPVTERMMRRGQRQYDIYCAPCHGLSGYGDGMVAKRADELALKGTPGMSWVPPKSLQDPDTMLRPAGHIFNTITNGIRTMPSYKGQISVDDRWAIILYMRALQRSQHASIGELPADQRAALLQGMASAQAAEAASAAQSQSAAVASGAAKTEAGAAAGGGAGEAAK